jgi:hypothetical protein
LISGRSLHRSVINWQQGVAIILETVLQIETNLR